MKRAEQCLSNGVAGSTSVSRRRFMQQVGAGMVAASLPAVSGRAQNVSLDPKLSLGVHHYSVRRVLKSGQASLASLPSFAKKVLSIPNLELAEELSTELLESSAAATRLRHRAEDEGVRVLTLLCDSKKALDAPGKAERQAAVEHHLGLLDAARLLNCRFVRIRADQAGEPEACLENAVAGISELCRRIGPGDPKPLVENVGGHTRNPDWLLKLVQTVGKDRCGLLADFGNFDDDIYDGMKKLLPHAESLCTKSWDFDENGDETKIDYARMCRLVRESGFSGCLSMEYLGQNTGDVEGLKRTATLLGRYL